MLSLADGSMLSLADGRVLNMNSLQDRITEAFAEKENAKKADLARAANVSPSAVSQWFSGESQSMRLEPALGAANYLGVNPLWLAEGKGPKKAHALLPGKPLENADAQALAAYLLEHPAVAESILAMIRAIKNIGAHTDKPAANKLRADRFAPGKAIKNEEQAGNTIRGKTRS